MTSCPGNRGDGWIRDPDFIGAEIALHRAAVRARREALKTCGYVVLWQDGKVVQEPVHEMWETESKTIPDFDK